MIELLLALLLVAYVIGAWYLIIKFSLRFIEIMKGGTK
tara:strand:+ start:734 stop:847 length:114 start_codon:yes stop_codon:yes gene_type:complete